MIIKISIAALISSVVLYFIFRDNFVRFSGKIPLISNDSFNRSVHMHSNSRPARYIFAITGGYRTGKSLILHKSAQNDAKNGLCPIVIDLGFCSKLEEAIDIMKLKVAEALTEFYPNLGSADIKQLTDMHKFEHLVNTNLTVQFPSVQISKIYSIISTSLDSILENGFNEYGVFRFFDVLSYYEPIFHFTLYIHNYDNIFSFSTKAEPKEGERFNEAAIARLSNCDQFTEFIPIYVELKNSLRMMNSSSIVKFAVTPNVEKESAKLVSKKVFRSSEYKTIMQEFGAHPGVMAGIFEDLKYNILLDTSISNQMSTISKMINDAIGGSSNRNIQAYCKNRDNFVISDKSMLESMYGLFANCLLFIKQDMKVEAANKAVANILCNLK